MDDLTTLRSRERVVVLSTRLNEFASTIKATYYKSGYGSNFTNNIINGKGYGGIIEVREISHEYCQ